MAAPAFSALVSGLTNGASYTFVVTATNAIGTSPPSVASPPSVPGATQPPAYVQGASAQTAKKTSLAVTMASNTTKDNRIIVEVGVWGSSAATVSNVTDNAGDVFTKVTSFVASDKTQISVWTAVVATGGTKPVITATVSASADVGVAAVEYSGLSKAAALGSVDKVVTASGTTSSAGSVTSGPTDPVSGGLAIGFYADSGFGNTLAADPAYAARVNLSPNGNMDMLIEDRIAAAGSRPAPTATTGASTVWLMTTVVFLPG